MGLGGPRYSPIDRAQRCRPVIHRGPGYKPNGPEGRAEMLADRQWLPADGYWLTADRYLWHRLPVRTQPRAPHPVLPLKQRPLTIRPLFLAHPLPVLPLQLRQPPPHPLRLRRLDLLKNGQRLLAIPDGLPHLS